MTLIRSNLNRFKKKSLKDSWVNLQLNGYLKSHRTVATLPCETIMSAKQALNGKLQGITAAYLRCGGAGVINNQIKQGLLLSLRIKKIKIGEYLAKLQARVT